MSTEVAAVDLLDTPRKARMADQVSCPKVRKAISDDALIDAENSMSLPAPHLVIIGGGFAGLWCTRALASAPVRITLVDKANHHLSVAKSKSGGDRELERARAVPPPPDRTARRAVL